jgi:hypothetical protein
MQRRLERRNMTRLPHNTDTPTVHALHESRARLTEMVSKSKYWPPGKPPGELLTEDEIVQLQRDMDRDWPDLKAKLLGVVARTVTRFRELEKAAQSKRQRRPSVETVLRKAKEAGASSVITRDGDHVAFGEPPADSRPNEWDEVLPNAANKKRPA